MAVGIGTGFGAVIFIWMLNKIGFISVWLQETLGIAGLFLGMALAGLLVGFVVNRWASEAKGHGVPEVMEAISVRGGKIRPRVAAIKVFASSLTIGFGGSAGREGPIVQVGSALGSTLGQMLHFSNDRVRTLVACGAAAGIAATFNAPIAGTIFALEVILRRFTTRYFGAVVISAVSAAIVGRAFLGDKPAFTVPAYSLNHISELFIYTVLGLLAAVVAVLFIRFLYRLEKISDEWKLPQAYKASFGMILTAGVGLLFPKLGILGPGLEMIGETIAEDFQLSLGLMFALLIAKMLATGFTLGAGNSGGVFAPSLFMGAILGGIIGSVGQMLFPNIVLHPGAYAIVGMAAVFAGAARAPITAVLIVFEMSNDYRLILPLMLATVLSTQFAEYLFPYSIYTLKLKLKGVAFNRGRDEDVLQGVTVGEVMTRNISTISSGLTLQEAATVFAKNHRHGMAVLNSEGNFWGIVTINDLNRAIDKNLPPETLVSQIAMPRTKLLVAHPDESIGEALARMGTRGIGRLPVLARDDGRHLLGLLRRDDVIRAYQVGLVRRAELQHRTKHLQLRNIDGTEFMGLTLKEGDKAVGSTISELSQELPEECVFVSIRRQGRMIIPHGETVLQAGDQITAFLATNKVKDFEGCLCTFKSEDEAPVL